jgi:hypothetical protein
VGQKRSKNGSFFVLKLFKNAFANKQQRVGIGCSHTNIKNEEAHRSEDRCA